ncbi:MAG: Tol-Pal system beta propeller repeat protein TolB [Deltaproteobacteria bacterium]|nr:Tol-Pal system beta propeller repeat protein TolB [Deltaproteobacteria bacterium]
MPVNSMHARRLLSLLLLLALGLPSLARAERPYIDISGATFRPYPLAIPRPLTASPDQGAAADLLVERLRYDLDVSGLFQVLDPRSFLARPDEGMTALAIKFNDWANVGAEGLLKIQLSAEGEKLKVEARLFGVTRAEQLAEWTFEDRAAEVRSLAHRLADAVVHYFTRERSIFDTRLTFIRKIDGKKQVWVSDWDGNGARRVVGGELNLLPAWSPAGDGLLFTSYRDGDPDLYTATLDGKVKRLVGGDAMFTGGAYSPDGKKVAFTRIADGNAEIYLTSSQGGKIERLTDAYGVDTSPSWSPDGQKIAFVSSRHGNPHIFVMNADGSGQKRITFQGNYNQTPDWSPRGDVIAFTARDERNVFDLFTVNPDTGEIRRLTQDTGNNEEPSFSPNGRHIAFTSTRSGTPRIYIMNADGTGQRLLDLPAGSYYTPAWGPWTAKAD